MSRNDVPPTLTPHVDPATLEQEPSILLPVPPARSSETTDRFASWVIQGPLIVALAGLCVLQLSTWIPHYLTWPYWADHDVFATIAQGWDDGLLPYRDLPTNNFPGTIYLFWILGKMFGWGRTMPFYALDAVMLVTLGGLLLVWSRRRLGGILPGLVGYLTFVSYYLGLDYAHAAQRDWQGPFFAVVSLLVVQTWPGRSGLVCSALAMAFGMSIRPQVVLFLPALALAIDETTRRSGESVGKTVRALSTWAIAFTLFVGATFLPLVLAGVVSDFIQGVRLAAYGNSYNRVTPISVLMGWLSLVSPLRTSLVPLAIGILALRTDGSTRRMALVWIAALGFGSLYKPLSPVAHTYLNIPLTLIWSVSLVVLVHLVLTLFRQVPSLQLVATLMILALGVTARPDFCAVGPTFRALASFRQGKLPDEKPPGYRKGSVGSSGVYPWRDYRALIDYLKHRTTPETLVANVLKADPAVTAPTARHSAFPVESMAWLRILRPEQQGDFADILARTRNAVVIWIPGEVGPDPEFKLDLLAAAIRDHYQPDVRFGSIEVWRRKPETATATQTRIKAKPGASPRAPARLSTRKWRALES